MTGFDRWRVCGNLVTISPLMLRTGAATEDDAPASEPTGPDDEATPRRKGEAAHTRDIEVDLHGRPVLPATALKGLLRALLARRCGEDDKDRIARLFGHEPRDTDDPDVKAGRGGRAEIRNAFVIGSDAADIDARSPEDLVEARGMVRIDRWRGAAADGALRTQDVALPGIRFQIDILVERAFEEEVRFLLAALRTIDGSVETAIGGGTRHGFGRIEWERDAERVQRITPQIVASWLSAPSVAGVPTRSPDGVEVSLEDWILPAPRGRSISLHLTMMFEGFFIVADAAHKKTKTGDPDRRPLDQRRIDLSAEEPNVPLLPGSGAKGPLRAQAERIWRTLTGDPSATSVDVIDELFGAVDRSAALSFSDFLGTKPLPERRQELIAIDRFTGGGADGSKFSHAVFEAPTLCGRLTVDLERSVNGELSGKEGLSAARRLGEAAIGLLALVLRDLAEGDIAFGFGTRKGYGHVSSVNVDGRSPVTAFRDALAAAGAPSPEDGILALRKRAGQAPSSDSGS